MTTEDDGHWLIWFLTYKHTHSPPSSAQQSRLKTSDSNLTWKNCSGSECVATPWHSKWRGCMSDLCLLAGCVTCAQNSAFPSSGWLLLSHWPSARRPQGVFSQRGSVRMHGQSITQCYIPRRPCPVWNWGWVNNCMHTIMGSNPGSGSVVEF